MKRGREGEREIREGRKREEGTEREERKRERGLGGGEGGEEVGSE